MLGRFVSKPELSAPDSQLRNYRSAAVVYTKQLIRPESGFVKVDSLGPVPDIQ